MRYPQGLISQSHSLWIVKTKIFIHRSARNLKIASYGNSRRLFIWLCRRERKSRSWYTRTILIDRGEEVGYRLNPKSLLESLGGNGPRNYSCQ